MTQRRHASADFRTLDFIPNILGCCYLNCKQRREVRSRNLHTHLRQQVFSKYSARFRAPFGFMRAMVDPALGVLEYAMKQQEKDIRGALAAAKEVLDRAKPEDGEEGTEVRNTVNFRFFDPPET
jgi:hypothetical protein